jgi:hypothetical protein
VRALPTWLVRTLGIGGLTALALFVFFNFVGKIDVSWALPWTKPFRMRWPDLPVFASWKTTTPDGHAETIYQVPTRQLTREEIAHLRYTPPVTNAVPATSFPPAAR